MPGEQSSLSELHLQPMMHAGCQAACCSVLQALVPGAWSPVRGFPSSERGNNKCEDFSEADKGQSPTLVQSS